MSTIPEPLPDYLSSDLYRENESVFFDPSDVERLGFKKSSLSAATYLTGSRADEQWVSAFRTVVERVGPLLYNSELFSSWHVWLFVCQTPWQPNSAMVNYHGLWRKLSGDLVDVLECGPEYRFESKRGVRFAGLARVREDAFTLAVEQARKDRGSCLFLAREVRHNEDTEVIFRSAFPPDQGGIERTRMDWLSLALSCTSVGRALVRVYGGFDDQVGSLDLIVGPNLYKKLLAGPFGKRT